MLIRFTVVDNRGFEIFIEADDFSWSGEYNRLSFSKENKTIAVFNTNNIIGFYQTKEGGRE